jgi:hypothetical protein
MPVVINCSWCNKTMGSVALSKIKDWDKGEVCDECVKKKDETLKVFESAVERTKNRLNLYREEAVKQLESEIKALAAKE